MKKCIKQIKSQLFKTISDIGEYKWMFCRNPETDFTRNRKWNFEDAMLSILHMGCESMDRELLRYFGFGKKKDIPTVSSFIQRRNQILPEAFQFLFHQITESVCKPKVYKGLRLLACDGSDINIPHNPKDETTYFKSTPGVKGFNQLHLNASYDLLGGFYQDIVIQPARLEHEQQAMINIIKRYNGPDAVFIADRGYESYNLMAHVIESNQYFLIRTKDVHSAGGICSGLKNKRLIPVSDVFDTWITLEFTRKQTNQVKQNPQRFRFVSSEKRFDYLPTDNKSITYKMRFRLLRFPISEDSYECIVTNLPDEFTVDEIKKIYHMRWGIETSFRELKYVEGLVNIHSRKMDFILQEIWCRLTLHNLYAAILAAAACQKSSETYVYQVNYTRAAIICKEFLFTKKGTSPPDVEKLLQMEMLPVRPGRHDERKLKPQTFRGFLYRAA